MDESSIKRATELFRKLDANGDGKIDKQDLQRGLGAWRDINPTHAQHIIDQADKNHDGTLDYTEFVNFMFEQEKQLQLVFASMDTNKDGSVSAEEVSVAYRKMGVEMSRSEAEKLIARLDRDGSRSIDFREFFEFFKFHNVETQSLMGDFRTMMSVGETGVPEDYAEEQLKSGFWWRQLCAGGVAGAISRTATAPLDRLKVILQVYGDKHRNITIRGGIEHMLQEGGVRSLWRGNLMNVVKIAPESALKFWAYEQMKSRLKNSSFRAAKGQPSEIQIWERFIAGASAGIFAQTCIYPLEVLKTKLTIRKTGEYKNVWDCVRQIYKHDGVRAFYRGYVPNLVGIIPYAGIDLAIYETIKNYSTRQLNERHERAMRAAASSAPLLTQNASASASAAPPTSTSTSTSTQPAHLNSTASNHSPASQSSSAQNSSLLAPASVPSQNGRDNLRKNGRNRNGSGKQEIKPGPLILLCCGTISSTCGQLVSYPFALVRTRLQAHPKHEPEVKWTRVLSHIWNESGVRGLYRGLLPNFLKVAPAVSVSYLCYEYTRRALGIA